MTVPAGDLRAAVATMMAAHWREGGYTVPHGSVYPWQWLWDSCFHSLIWAELGDGDRAVAELANVLAVQDELGFVPHMTYHGDPAARADFWGRPGTSSITQPPVYGHAAAELVRRGVAVPDELVERAVDGVRFLLEHRARTTEGLVTVVHPWETGCDDSPRWDGWCPGGYERARFREVKGELLATRRVVRGRRPPGQPRLRRRLRRLQRPGGLERPRAGRRDRRRRPGHGGGRPDRGPGRPVVRRPGDLDRRRPPSLGRGANGGRRCCRRSCSPATGTRPSPRWATGRGLGGPFGAAGTDRREPAYDPAAYWRGPVWPQVTYLLWVAASRAVHPVAGDLATGLRAGALASGLAEYWHPDTAAAGGAVPQSWTGLALLV